MNAAEHVSRQIFSFYADLLLVKEKDKLYKSLIKEQFYSLEKNRLSVNGVICSRKRRHEWVWHAEFYDFLADKNLLFKAVKIPDDAHTQYHLTPFQLPAEQYIKIAASKPYKKAVDHFRKKQPEKTAALQQLSLEDMVEVYKKNKMALALLSSRYDALKEQLCKMMVNTSTPALTHPEGTFKIYQKKPAYNQLDIFNQGIEKKVSFTYRILNSSEEIECTDNFRNETFAFHGETIHDGHYLQVLNQKLYVDGSELSVEKQSSTETGVWWTATATLFLSGNQFFKNCPISSANVDKLLDAGLLDPDRIADFRSVNTDKPATSFFEIIGTASHEARNQVFKEKKAARQQMFVETFA